MKCTACGYDDIVQEPFKSEHLVIDGTGPKKPFIELRSNVFVYTYDETKTIDGSKYVELYACPNCGTVRMDNGC